MANDLNSFLITNNQSEGLFLTNTLDINDNGSIVDNAYNHLSNVMSSLILQLVAAVPEVDTSAMLLMGALITKLLLILSDIVINPLD